MSVEIQVGIEPFSGDNYARAQATLGRWGAAVVANQEILENGATSEDRAGIIQEMGRLVRESREGSRNRIVPQELRPEYAKHEHVFRAQRLDAFIGEGADYIRGSSKNATIKFDKVRFGYGENERTEDAYRYTYTHPTDPNLDVSTRVLVSDLQKRMPPKNFEFYRNALDEAVIINNQ